ncbi:hypothetical protein B0O80DRAFT_435659 [Mortierella sp. GBAus27b]|nr:hypothetical protein B0O80DRAFT_435659 [Mortierella sp. GBAus27b]
MESLHAWVCHRTKTVLSVRDGLQCSATSRGPCSYIDEVPLSISMLTKARSKASAQMRRSHWRAGQWYGGERQRARTKGSDKETP